MGSGIIANILKGSFIYRILLGIQKGIINSNIYSLLIEDKNIYRDSGIPIKMGNCLYYSLSQSMNNSFIMSRIKSKGFILNLAVYGLYLIVMTLPLIPFRYVTLLFALTFIAFILKIAIDKDFSFKKIPFIYSISIYLVALFFSGITSIDRGQGIIRLSVYLMAFLFLFIAINIIDSKEKYYGLIISLIMASTIVGFYGIYQYVTGISLDENWVDLTLNPDIQRRVFSTFDNPNILAEYLILTIPITLAFLYNSRSFLRKLLLFISLSLQVVCIVFTYSRGGWIGLVFSILIFAIFVDKRLIFLYVFGGIGLIIVNPQAIITRISTIISLEDTSNLYRIGLWKDSLEMIKDYWFSGLGFGMDSFKVIHKHYARPGISAAHSHNTFLQIFLETGIFGIIGFMIFTINSLRISLISYVKGTNIRIKTIAIATMASLVGLLLHGLVDYIFFSEKILLMFWILISFGIIGYTFD